MANEFDAFKLVRVTAHCYSGKLIRKGKWGNNQEQAAIRVSVMRRMAQAYPSYLTFSTTLDIGKQTRLVYYDQISLI